jgi:hypothetical protein
MLRSVSIPIAAGLVALSAGNTVMGQVSVGLLRWEAIQKELKLDERQLKETTALISAYDGESRKSSRLNSTRSSNK